MKTKLVGYKAPFDLFDGAIPKDTLYKPLASNNNQSFAAVKENGSVFDSGRTNLPKEIVEEWEAVYKSEFEVGDIVVSLNDCAGIRREGEVFKVLALEIKGNIYYKKHIHGNPINFRIATPTEVEDYMAKDLLEEAKKRYPVGTRFIPAHMSERYGSMSIVTNDIFKIAKRQSNGISIYAMTDEGKYFNGDIQYGNTTFDRIVCFEGKWAEISSTPFIVINNYVGIFFDDYVKFGCAQISKQLFLELYAVKDSAWTNREVESITIGKGAFSKDQIKEIAEYYLNKTK